jgi:hypothetical protein
LLKSAHHAAVSARRVSSYTGCRHANPISRRRGRR